MQSTAIPSKAWCSGGGGEDGGGGCSIGEVEEIVQKDPMTLIGPHVYTEEELHATGPKLQELVAADWNLIGNFGAPSIRMMVPICTCKLQCLWIQAANDCGKMFVFGRRTFTTCHMGRLLTNS